MFRVNRGRDSSFDHSRLGQSEQIFLVDRGANVDRPNGDDGDENLIGRDDPAFLELLGRGAGRRPIPSIAPAEVNQAVGRRVDHHGFSVLAQVRELRDRLGIIVLQLRGREPLLTEVQGSERAGFLQVDRLLDRVFPDTLFLPRQVDLQLMVALKLCLFEVMLPGIDLKSLAAKDDLFGLFGQILRAVHLLELAQLFLGVLQVFARLLDHEMGGSLGIGLLDSEESFQVFVSLSLGPRGGGQVDGQRLLQERQLFVCLLESTGR